MMNKKYIRRDNSLDELRFFLALSVVFIHLAHLSSSILSSQILDIIHILSVRAVDIFFVLSGFLIYMSWDYKQDIFSYSIKRVFRIYPAYFVVIGITSLCSLLVVENVEIYQVVRYFFYNSLFLNFVLPSIQGVFVDNQSTIINGALWSIKVEVMFYMILPLLYFFVERSSRPLLVISSLVLFSAFFNVFVYIISESGIYWAHSLYNQLPAKLYLFMFGIILYRYFCFFDKASVNIIFSVLVLSLLVYFWGFSSLASWMFSISVVLLAFKNYRFSIFSKYGDFSYSLYITHFPIIQLMLVFGVGFSTWIDLAFYFLIQSLLSIFIWYSIEKPNLDYGVSLVRKKK